MLGNRWPVPLQCDKHANVSTVSLLLSHNITQSKRTVVQLTVLQALKICWPQREQRIFQKIRCLYHLRRASQLWQTAPSCCAPGCWVVRNGRDQPLGGSASCDLEYNSWCHRLHPTRVGGADLGVSSQVDWGIKQLHRQLLCGLKGRPVKSTKVKRKWLLKLNY